MGKANLRSYYKIALRNFETKWFLIPQGTGIIAVILHQLHYQFNGLGIIADIFWLLTIISLTLFLVIYSLRIVHFTREVVNSLTTQSEEAACLACIPITFTSIIQMMALSLPRIWGHSWGQAAYVLWYINLALAVIACIGLPYVMLKYEPPGVTHISPTANLPIIAALTAAAGGGVLCANGDLTVHEQIPVIIVSYLLVGLSLPLALGLATAFAMRLMSGEAPRGVSTYQDMILCGPWGQSSFALQSLGSAVMSGSFASYNRGVFLTADAAKPVGYISIFGGLLCWAHGTFWWAFAIIGILNSGFNGDSQWKGFQFGLQAWSLIFPWGVYTNACIELGKLLDSRAFSIWSAVLTVSLVILWLMNIVLTTKKAVKRLALGQEGL